MSKKINLELAVDAVEMTADGVKVTYKKGAILLPMGTSVPVGGTLRVQIDASDVTPLEKGNTVSGAVAQPAVAVGGQPTRDRDF